MKIFESNIPKTKIQTHTPKCTNIIHDLSNIRCSDKLNFHKIAFNGFQLPQGIKNN